MIKQALGCVVVFGCLMASASLQAHHSTAGIYDPAKSGEVTGTLSKLQFVNPHGSITITTTWPRCCWIAAPIRMSPIGGDAQRSGSSSIEKKP